MQGWQAVWLQFMKQATGIGLGNIYRHLEDMEWLERPRPFEQTSGNTWGGHIAEAQNNKPKCLFTPAAVCT